MWELFRSLKKVVTPVLLTTHDMDEAEQIADRVCVLDKGILQTVDTPANLMNFHDKKNLEEVFLSLTEVAQV